MIKRRKNITDPKQTILIVCATEAEALYFSQMRKDCRYVNLTVLTSPKQDIKTLIDYTGRERSRGRFDSAWALFGFDDVSIDKDGLKEVEEVAERKKVKLCWFNPSFELWFAFHLTAPSSFTTDLAPYMNKLRESFPGFALTMQGTTIQSQDRQPALMQAASPCFWKMSPQSAAKRICPITRGSEGRWRQSPFF